VRSPTSPAWPLPSQTRGGQKTLLLDPRPQAVVVRSPGSGLPGRPAASGCARDQPAGFSSRGPANRQAGAAEGTALQHHHPVTATEGRVRAFTRPAPAGPIVAIEPWSGDAPASWISTNRP